jgi:hypothetical protein
MENVTSRENLPSGRSRPRAGIRNTVTTSMTRNKERFNCDSQVCAIKTRLFRRVKSLRSLIDGVIIESEIRTTLPVIQGIIESSGEIMM